MDYRFCDLLLLTHGMIGVHYEIMCFIRLIFRYKSGYSALSLSECGIMWTKTRMNYIPEFTVNRLYKAFPHGWLIMCLNHSMVV